jgi:hypothetical protein
MEGSAMTNSEHRARQVRNRKRRRSNYPKIPDSSTVKQFLTVPTCKQFLQVAQKKDFTGGSMQTILDGIMGKILEYIGLAIALMIVAAMGAFFLMAYVASHLHIYWK